jgi:hypothetical protein
MHRMKASIPWLQSALDFFLNRILICYWCSQIFDLSHPLKETIINVYTLISSKLVYCTKIEFQSHREHVAHYRHLRTNAVYCYSRGELNDLFSSPNIVRVIKSRRMRWAGHVARMGRGHACTGSWLGNLRARDDLGDPGVDGRIILNGSSGSGIWGYGLCRADSG